jgi:hypothetical protein
MGGAAPTVVVAAAAAAGAFGFVVFLAAKAPEVETAKIARPTRIIFFMLKLSLTWKKDASAVEHKARIARQAGVYALGMTRFHCKRLGVWDERWKEKPPPGWNSDGSTHYSRGWLVTAIGRFLIASG